MTSRIIEYENLKKLNEPFFSSYQEAFNRVMRSGWYILGENVKAFEAEFASYNGVAHCAGVASGLDAIELALKALPLKPGGEVIVPSNTYIATILAVIKAGLRPVLAEPEIAGYNISPAEIRAKITPRTVAVLIVHLYGLPCDMDEINGICAEHKLYLIEDCAQAHGADYKGKKVGTFGIGAFSFLSHQKSGGFG